MEFDRRTGRSRRFQGARRSVILRFSLMFLFSLTLLFSIAMLPGCWQTPSSEVWVIGLDGADWDVLDPLMKAGKLPHLAALRDESAWGVLLSDEPMLSPILWTSIATGKTADQHGVTWFMSDAADGTKVPVSSHDRRVRALWNIASEHDLDVGVVGWWATWPAEDVSGYLVSDYVAWHSFGITGRQLGASGTTYPEAFEKAATNMVPAPSSVDPALLQKMFHLPATQLASGAAVDAYSESVEHVRQAIATTEGYTQVALHLIEKERPELMAVYFEGTDAAQHLFMNHAPPRLPWVSEEEFAAYKDVVSEYWSWQDEQLGRILSKRGPNTNVVVVSDHGFRRGVERLMEEEFRVELADASHLPDGIIMISGPNVRAGTKISGVDVYDVAPTVLHLLGLPVAQDFSGEPIVNVLENEWRFLHPVETVPTFETGTWERGGDVAVDPAAGKNMEKMLKSLGYISGGTSTESPESGGAAVAASGGVEHAVNMAFVLMRQDRFDEAARTLEEVLEKHPGHAEATSNLARVYAETGEYSRAEKLQRDLLRAHPAELDNYEDLAHTLVLQEKNEEARKIYNEGLVVDRAWTAGMVGKALAMNALGDGDAALALLDRALAQDSRNATAHYHRGLILSEEGSLTDALLALERATELDPGHVETAIALSALNDKLGDLDSAMAVVEAARRYKPDDVQLAAQAGAVHLRMGQIREALTELSRAAKELDDPIVLGNYGMARAAAGDLDGAARSFERVVELDPNSHEAMATLGQMYMQLKRFKEAEELLNRAILLDPGNARIQFALGVMYDMTGQLDLAGKQYEAAIEIDDTVGVYYYQLGKVYGRQGKSEEAVELLEKGREHDPSLPAPRM